MSLPLHGGDLASAETRWGRPERGWLDLSTGINPWPYAPPPVPPDAWRRLPGAEAEQGLRAAAARRFGCRPDQVLAAPGTSALIQALPRLQPPGRVAILSPTYGEHARAWEAAGHHVRPVASLAEATGAQVVVAVNPNNPDGRPLPPENLLACTAPLVVADEAFGEAAPALSLVPRLRPGLVVLRSFGKFYGLAGLRLGFALGEPDLLKGLAAQLGPWPVSGIALEVGKEALADEQWAHAMAQRLAAMAARLDNVLTGAKLEIVGGTTLFRLARHQAAAEIYDRLGRAGILVRAFAAQPEWLRFGLPPDEAGLARLRDALA